MKSTRRMVIVAVAFAGLLSIPGARMGQAAPLTDAKITEAYNKVLYKPEVGQERRAKLGDVVEGEDVLRTGASSLAEVEFADQTITRLGSKTVFTFSASAREFHTGYGTTLICMPKGAGGGTIVSAAITAAIEGTTVIVEESDVAGTAEHPDPRVLSKVIFLEGHGTVRLTHPGAKCPVDHESISAGQMIAQYSDQPCLAPVQDVDLAVLLDRSGIITGFYNPLPSLRLIKQAVKQQQSDIGKGILQGSGGGPTVYSPNPSTGSQGISDPPAQNPSIAQGSIVPVGDGFLLSNRPLPGSQPIQGGGGYLIRP